MTNGAANFFFFPQRLKAKLQAKGNLLDFKARFIVIFIEESLLLECVHREAMHVLFSLRGAITGLLIVLCKSAQAKILKVCNCCHFVPTAEIS